MGGIENSSPGLGKKSSFKTVARSQYHLILSVFLIPKTLYEEMEVGFNAFWWGRNKDEIEVGNLLGLLG